MYDLVQQTTHVLGAGQVAVVKLFCLFCHYMLTLTDKIRNDSESQSQMTSIIEEFKQIFNSKL